MEADTAAAHVGEGGRELCRRVAPGVRLYRNHEVLVPAQQLGKVSKACAGARTQVDAGSQEYKSASDILQPLVDGKLANGGEVGAAALGAAACGECRRRDERVEQAKSAASLDELPSP